jgi:hypothetical protein
MIFKHLFRSKYLDPNPNVRLQAVAALNKGDPKHKSILHELAFNDPEVKVSLAALQKLDNFSLWYKMFEIAKNERVTKRAQQVVEAVLLGDCNSQLSAAQKRNVIVECRDLRLLEKLLEQAWVQADTELAIQLLAKIDKPYLQEKLLLEGTTQALSLAILAEMIDGPNQRKLLQRLSKKSPCLAVKEQGQLLLEKWQQAQQLPKQIEQQVTMLLSRLLALKDHQDVSHMEQQQTALLAQYHQLHSQFSCLAVLRQKEIEQRFVEIQKRVAHRIGQLKPEWQTQQDQLAALQAVTDIGDQVDLWLHRISNQLLQHIEQMTQAEGENLNQQLVIYLAQINQLKTPEALTNKAQRSTLSTLTNRLLAVQHTLLDLEACQQAIKGARVLLQQFEGLALPNDPSQIDAAHQYGQELNKQWKNTTANYVNSVPRDLSFQWQSQLSLWQKAIKTVGAELDQALKRCKNKLQVIESLIEQGKFKAAMGLYQKVVHWYSALPEKQQSQLKKNFDNVQDKIAELKDWQDYIAAPRKPALLDQAQALVSTPLVISEQAKTIRALRTQWNSLGKIESESDELLNRAFEQAIELAYAPCQQFYDLQQQERANNLVHKQQLLDQLKGLDDPTLLDTSLAKAFRDIQQQWQKIAEVDFKHRPALYNEYQRLCAPIHDKVQAYYQENAQHKQLLVDKAQLLLSLEPIAEAIEQGKKLQGAWKTIEHAGKQAEAPLWSAFRQAIDALFAKRAAVSKEQKQQQDQQLQHIKGKVVELENLVEQASDHSALQQAFLNQQSVLHSLFDLPPSDKQALTARMQKLLDVFQDKQHMFKQAERDHHYQQLFTVLSLWQDPQALPELATALPKKWLQCLLNVTDDQDREQLTIKMEIVAQHESPLSETALRQKLQMQLMAQKLQSGESWELQELLTEWLRAGPLSKTDLSLLARIKPLFISQ